MKARQVYETLKSLDDGWVRWDQTVDTFKAGDPDTELQGIAVAWMSYTWALRRALNLGCNLFITHEPTFYDHLDGDPRWSAMPGVQEKQRFIEENKLVILRCHDLWDQFPRLGILIRGASSSGWGKRLMAKDTTGYTMSPVRPLVRWLSKLPGARSGSANRLSN
jgi:hypothetical protein